MNYRTKEEARAKLYAMQSKEVTQALDRMRARYPAAPTIEAVRERLSKVDHSLTEELYRMRGCDG